MQSLLIHKLPVVNRINGHVTHQQLLLLARSPIAIPAPTIQHAAEIAHGEKALTLLLVGGVFKSRLNIHSYNQ